MTMKFDAYEYIGVIIPGSVLVVSLVKIFPELAPNLTNSLSLGDFGLMLILSLVAGQLIQAVGNLLENVMWWFTGGMPTTWPAQSKTSLISTGQIKRLSSLLKSDFDADLETLGDGRAPIREIFVKIRKSGNVDRIEIFNRNYGLLRGIASAFLVAALLAFIKDPNHWLAYIPLLIAGGIATYRMNRFGQHYARELFAEYLRSSDNSSKDQSTRT